jgi:hypothetical protein
MADYDGGFKIAARCSGAGLSRLAEIVADEWEPIGDTLQTTERLADRAFRVSSGGQRFVVYMEAYTRWVESAPWSVLSKSGLLSERERLPTWSLIFILLRQGYQEQQGTFRLEALPGRPTQQIWFTEVPLWKQKPQAWWDYHPGLMALSPLCDHGQTTAQAVRHAAESIRHREMDGLRRGELLTTLAIFGRLADSDLDVLSIIRREEMHESSLAQEFVLEGEQNGIRQAVVQALTLRFGEEQAREFTEAVGRITDLDRLRELHRLAIQARRVSQFRRALTGGKRS